MLKKTRKLAHEHAAELWDTAKRTLLILRGIKILLTKNVNMQIVKICFCRMAVKWE